MGIEGFPFGWLLALGTWMGMLFVGLLVGGSWVFNSVSTCSARAS